MKRFNMRLHTDYGACYMQAYEPVLLENDRQSELLLRRLNPLQNPSFHDFTGEEPITVLDLGCGSGRWLMEAANYWKQAIITGVDMVDILVPEARNHHQIDFIQGNFLIFPWPFPSRQFDFVRLANLSLCIPYDKWEPILSEIHRILTINGRFELIVPYAPAPVSRPMYETEEDEDDVASVNTDSTLVSDGDTSSPSQRTRRQSSIPTSDVSSGVPQQLPFPALPGTDPPTTPNSVLTIKPIDTIQKSQPDWNTEAAACRDIETVFQNMLHKKFGVHSQPSKFVPEVIQHVFGNVKKPKSYHLKLAPKDAYKQFGGVEANELDSLGKKEESAPESKKSSRSKWFCSDKEEKKRAKKTSKPSTPTSGRHSIMTLSASPGDSNVSAKAANRLGISYSELSEATALAKASTRRPVSSSSTLVTGSTPPVQSPGLIVWPNRFIPMSPEELEIHALKNVHMLIGCKPALIEFVRTFLDEDGNRITSDEDFEQALWDFRRRRFNWPADISSDWETDGDLDASDSTSAPTSKPGADTPTSAKSAAPRNPTLLSSLADSASSALDKIDELTHVRTIRVFEAVKAEEYTLSTMKNPRSSPPNPRR
ncbi:hypothetical protein J132_10654 [Termitomyces sp. J132]|nr:hypothetical protein J132_10654 [Termitomyces sp. J132]